MDRVQLAAKVSRSVDPLRPTIPDGMPPVFAALLRCCWAADPRARPSALQVEQQLRHIIAWC